MSDSTYSFPNLDESDKAFPTDLLNQIKTWLNHVRKVSDEQLFSLDESIIWLWNKSVVIGNLRGSDHQHAVAYCKFFSDI